MDSVMMTMQDTEGVILAAHEEVKKGVLHILGQARIAGERLNILRSILKQEGIFMVWLNNFCARYKMSRQTAYDYMAVADNWSSIERRAAEAGYELSDMSINKALTLVRGRKEKLADAKASLARKEEKERKRIEDEAKNAEEESDHFGPDGDILWAADHWSEVEAAASEKKVDLSALSDPEAKKESVSLAKRHLRRIVQKLRTPPEKEEEPKAEELPPGSLWLAIENTNFYTGPCPLPATTVTEIQKAIERYQLRCDLTSLVGFMVDVIMAWAGHPDWDLIASFACPLQQTKVAVQSEVPQPAESAPTGAPAGVKALHSHQAAQGEDQEVKGRKARTRLKDSPAPQEDLGAAAK